MNAEPVSLNAIRSTFETLVSNRFLVTVYPSVTGSVTSGTGMSCAVLYTVLCTVCDVWLFGV